MLISSVSADILLKWEKLDELNQLKTESIEKGYNQDSNEFFKPMRDTGDNQTLPTFIVNHQQRSDVSLSLDLVISEQQQFLCCNFDERAATKV